MRSTQNAFSRYQANVKNRPRVSLPLEIMLMALGLDWKKRRDIGSEIASLMVTASSEDNATTAVWRVLGQYAPRVSELLAGRAEHVATSLNQHIVGANILDFGAGDGQIGALIEAYGKGKVSLYDPTLYTANNVHGLPRYHQWTAFENALFDTAISSVVLHHCDSPDAELARLVTVAQRLVVIESVLDDRISWTDQFQVDWLYNRGLHPGANIPVPGQFRTVPEWRESFANVGYSVIHEEDQGIDIAIVPEHHYLFVCERA